MDLERWLTCLLRVLAAQSWGAEFRSQHPCNRTGIVTLMPVTAAQGVCYPLLISTRASHACGHICTHVNLKNNPLGKKSL